MAKPKKITDILSNQSFKDDLVIAVGDQSFTVGELRALDAETSGGSSTELDARQADLESREGVLTQAQAETMNILQGVADHLGVSLDDMIGNTWKGKTRRAAVASTRTQNQPPPDEFEGMAPEVVAAIKTVRSTFEPQITALKTELQNTKQALGIGMSTYMDQFYEDQFDRLAPSVPKGKDGKPLVNIDLKSALKYATDNKLTDARGRLNLSKAFKDMTADARLQLAVQEAEARGEERGRLALVAASAQRPGHNRPAHLTAPPTVTENVGGHQRTRTKTLDEALADARNDTSIWEQAITGTVQ